MLARAFATALLSVLVMCVTFMVLEGPRSVTLIGAIASGVFIGAVLIKKGWETFFSPAQLEFYRSQ